MAATLMVGSDTGQRLIYHAVVRPTATVKQPYLGVQHDPAELIERIESRQGRGNIEDRDKRDGITARGSRHGRSKLAEDKVRALREAYAEGDTMPAAEGETMPALAQRYGIDRKAISQVVYRKTWRHVA